MANPLHLKASRVKILNTFPNNNFGKDGDIVFANVMGKGVYLCTKVNGVWYAPNRMSELSRIERMPLDVYARKIRIQDVKKSSLSTEKFIVTSNSGELEYRTSLEAADDLNLDLHNLSINYKTAYCSLGQYSIRKIVKLIMGLGTILRMSLMIV